MTDTPSAQQLERLRELIQDVKFAMLTTQARDGTLTSRPMTTLQADTGWTLWFLASADAEYASDLAERPKVNLGYARPEAGHYISVCGVARVVRDAAKARELWNPLFSTWFPGGPDDPSLRVLQVDIEGADYWESARGKPERVWGLVKAAITGDRAALGKHEHVQVTQHGAG